MFERPDDFSQEACPCGEEPIDTRFGEHVVGLKCRAQIERQVRNRFGPHRYRGRFSQDVEDVVQECYKKLVRPGGLDSFRAPTDRPLVTAFRAWLWSVVHFLCNNTHDAASIRPPPTGDGIDTLSGLTHPKTPAQAFARQCLIDLANAAVADVEPRWRDKGADWSERFDVFLPFVLQQDDDYERAQKRLGIKYENAKQLKWRLSGEVRVAARARMLDELSPEPGLSPAATEAKIDEDIEALFAAAFPDDDNFTLGFLEPEPEPPPEAKSALADAPPESKP